MRSSSGRCSSSAGRRSLGGRSSRCRPASRRSILATTPLWMVLAGEHARVATAPAPRVLAGVAVGIVGLAILIGPSLVCPGTGVDLLGIIGLVIAALAWSGGAMYSRRSALRHVSRARDGHADDRRGNPVTRLRVRDRRAPTVHARGDHDDVAACRRRISSSPARSWDSAPTSGSCACRRRLASQRTRT